MLLRLRQEPPTVAERSLRDRAERSRRDIRRAIRHQVPAGFCLLLRGFSNIGSRRMISQRPPTHRPGIELACCSDSHAKSLMSHNINSLKKKRSTATIVADGKRFSHQINTEKFSAHTTVGQRGEADSRLQTGCPYRKPKTADRSPSAIAQRSRGNTRADLLGYLLRCTTRSRLCGNRGPTYVRANSAASSSRTHSNVARKTKAWLEHETHHAAETREA